mmetsp:Transcript_24675/g.36781  ORF Transcript_24675/g.36781 Transcript_24675/m.36781 type:complete len:236 (+) Transcript_24675:166-873(+)
MIAAEEVAVGAEEETMVLISELCIGEKRAREKQQHGVMTNFNSKTFAADYANTIHNKILVDNCITNTKCGSLNGVGATAEKTGGVPGFPDFPDVWSGEAGGGSCASSMSSSSLLQLCRQKQHRKKNDYNKTKCTALVPYKKKKHPISFHFKSKHHYIQKQYNYMNRTQQQQRCFVRKAVNRTGCRSFAPMKTIQEVKGIELKCDRKEEQETIVMDIQKQMSFLSCTNNENTARFP